MSIQEAFLTVCNEAVPANGFFVSLYLRSPWYGGPEEGGWWGHDTILMAYKWYPTEQQAIEVKDRVEKLAAELDKQASRDWSEHCARELEWCEARGLDSDFLPETDGPDSYSVYLEEVLGEYENRPPRHYE